LRTLAPAGVQERRQSRNSALLAQTLANGLVHCCPPPVGSVEDDGNNSGGVTSVTTGSDIDHKVEHAGQGLAPSSVTEQSGQCSRPSFLHELLLPLIYGRLPP
jgi:hypothetical protein